MSDTVSVIVRSLSFVLLFQAIGAGFFSALFAPLRYSDRALHRLIAISSVGAVLTIGLHLVLETTRMTGDFSGLYDLSTYRIVLHSSTAASHGMQVLGLLFVVFAADGRIRNSKVLLSIGGAIGIAGFLLVGHTSVHPRRVLLAMLLAIHLLIVAFWFGSLAPLWIVSRRESRIVTAGVLQDFSSLATWLVPVIAVAGIALTLFIADGVPPLNEPYGALILTKLCGFAALMALAAWNKFRLTPAISTRADKPLFLLRRSLLVEFLLIVGVLTATAAMTSFFSPHE